MAGSGELIGLLEDAGIGNGINCQPPAAVKGCFPRDRFAIDLRDGTATCPAGVTVLIRARDPGGRHAGTARLGAACRACPWPASAPPPAPAGRSPSGTTRPAWPPPGCASRTRPGELTTRPPARTAERKIGHLMRRRHGGRRARVRGQARVAADLLAAAVNLARLAVLGVACRNGAWVASGG